MTHCSSSFPHKIFGTAYKFWNTYLNEPIVKGVFSALYEICCFFLVEFRIICFLWLFYNFTMMHILMYFFLGFSLCVLNLRMYFIIMKNFLLNIASSLNSLFFFQDLLQKVYWTFFIVFFLTLKCCFHIVCIFCIFITLCFILYH